MTSILRYEKMNTQRTVILYIAMSLDVYIATSDNGHEFLFLMKEDGLDYSYTGFVNSIDIVIVGYKSYNKVDWITNFICFLISTCLRIN